MFVRVELMLLLCGLLLLRVKCLEVDDNRNNSRQGREYLNRRFNTNQRIVNNNNKNYGTIKEKNKADLFYLDTTTTGPRYTPNQRYTRTTAPPRTRIYDNIDRTNFKTTTFRQPQVTTSSSRTTLTAFAGSFRLPSNNIIKNDIPEIPLEIVRRLNSINSTNELYQLFNDMPIRALHVAAFNAEISDVQVEDRMSDIEPRNSLSATIAKAAACIPQLALVEFDKSTDPTVVFYPTCTRVERCGGCCSHSLLSCQPDQVEKANFQVIKTQYVGGTKLQYLGKELMQVDKHISCKCDCKVIKEDCNHFQLYLPSECRCACINKDDESKCSNENDIKFWDISTCICQCRFSTECTTGYFYDQNTCTCIQVPTVLQPRVVDGFEFLTRRGEGGRLLKYDWVDNAQLKTSTTETSQSTTTTTILPEIVTPRRSNRRRFRNRRKRRNNENKKK